jgi:hypothetical protein
MFGAGLRPAEGRSELFWPPREAYRRAGLTPLRRKKGANSLLPPGGKRPAAAPCYRTALRQPASRWRSSGTSGRCARRRRSRFGARTCGRKSRTWPSEDERSGTGRFSCDSPKRRLYPTIGSTDRASQGRLVGGDSVPAVGAHAIVPVPRHGAFSLCFCGHVLNVAPPRPLLGIVLVTFVFRPGATPPVTLL